MEGKRLLMAVLEADVFGYSKLVAEDEVKAAAAVAQRFEEFDKIAKSHGAQQTAHEGGDSFLAIFPSAQSAAVASVESQMKFWRMNQAAKIRPLSTFGSVSNRGMCTSKTTGQPALP